MKPGRCTQVPSGPVLYTVGYEGRTQEQYLQVLTGAGVTLLCDVRWAPVSRKKGFSKRALAEACSRASIRYELLSALGIPPEKRRHIGTDAQRDALFREYVEVMLPEQGEAVDVIRGWVRDGEVVALTCYEREARQCHRRLVAEAVGYGDVKHL